MRPCIFYIASFFILVSCQQETRHGTSADLVPFKNKKEKWGYMDSISKKTVIPCIYDSADSFKVNRAIVGIFVHKPHNCDYFERGVIDTLGNIIIPIKYKEVGGFLDRYFYVVVYLDDESLIKKEGILDWQGKEIIPPIYDDIEIKEDIFVITHTYDGDNDSYGCYNLNLKKEIIPCKYKEIYVLHKEITVLTDSGKYKYTCFNQEGKPFPPLRIDFMDNNGFFDFGKTEDVIDSIDSIKISQKKFVANYSFFMKGDYYNDDDILVKYLKKKNVKLYNKIHKITTACCFYQGDIHNTMSIDMFTDAVIKPFHDDLAQPFEFKLLIITLYQGKKQQNYLFITSMKAFDKKQK